MMEHWGFKMEIDEIPVGKAQDLRGQKFGKLTVLYRTGTDKSSGVAIWKCQCECGNYSYVRAAALRSNRIKSCGCTRKEHLDKIRPTMEKAKTQAQNLQEDELPVFHAKDLTGQRFGKLKVLYRTYKPTTAKSSGSAFWKCQCDCGNITVISGNSLLNGVKSCGCSNGPINEIGNKYGRLTVIAEAERPEKITSTVAYWKCRCECGKETIVRGAALRNGRVLSCGCLAKERASEVNLKPLLPGEHYGKLTIIQRIGKDKYGAATYLCQCDCGNTTIVDRRKLITGNTQSCGCIKSHGEQKIQNILQQENLSYKKEKTFDDCWSKEGGKFRFDFYVNNSYLIEYDGIQHFEPKFIFANKDFELQQQRDKMKNEYCKTHNIPLIRIPYWHYDKITIDDLRPETSQFLI